jgi:hypothetical protein
VAVVRVRVGAHPLVVAVALGLLAPEALADEDDEASVEGAPTTRTLDPTAAPLDAAELSKREIDPADFARIEQEWFVYRKLGG